MYEVSLAINNRMLYRSSPGMLKQFIADLHSGKLHREFHQGPDPTPPPVIAPVETTEVCDAYYLFLVHLNQLLF